MYSTGQILRAPRPTGSKFLTDFKCLSRLLRVHKDQLCALRHAHMGTSCHGGSTPSSPLTSTLTSDHIHSASCPVQHLPVIKHFQPQKGCQHSLQVCTAAWQIKTASASNLLPACPSPKVLLNRVRFWLYFSVSN